MIRGKYDNITLDDVLQLAAENGIRKAESIIHEIAEAMLEFRPLAQKHGVHERWIAAIENTLNINLEAWGLAKPITTEGFIDDQGRKIEHARIEQQFKGNYHLLATINGKERKYVIRKKTTEHEEISRTGISNLSTDYLKELVLKYLI